MKAFQGLLLSLSPLIWMLLVASQASDTDTRTRLLLLGSIALAMLFPSAEAPMLPRAALKPLAILMLVALTLWAAFILLLTNASPWMMTTEYAILVASVIVGIHKWSKYDVLAAFSFHPWFRHTSQLMYAGAERVLFSGPNWLFEVKELARMDSADRVRSKQLFYSRFLRGVFEILFFPLSVLLHVLTVRDVRFNPQSPTRHTFNIASDYAAATNGRHFLLLAVTMLAIQILLNLYG